MFKFKTNSFRRDNPAFTIVELLVVIVVIGILAAITIVSYSGISSRANLASLQSDIDSNSKTLKLYYAINGYYPLTFDANNCPQTPVADITRCLKLSPNNSYTYSPSTPTNPQDFRLTIANASTGNYYSDNAASISCPSNFIIVPGSSTYGTSDFCVMKYEAKQIGSTTTPVSQASGLPWVSISQTTAIANSSNVDGCNGCHLITEAEWMTIAQNVLSVPSNWDNGAGIHTVGTGYIYSGHNDNVPVGQSAADPNDANGYTGTGNVSPSNQKRTLTLTNGEVIWDLAGNVYEWTLGVTTGNQPGVTGGGYIWREWNSAFTTNGNLTVNPFPSGTGLSGASGWSSTNGVGMLYSNSDEVGTRGFVRGGGLNRSTGAGVLSLELGDTSSHMLNNVGFRVSR